MIKKAKKSVAVGLSVALAVTSVNIPFNSASAAAKKAKLSATKKTLTAGKSTTLTLKTNKKKAKTIKTIKAKYVKVSTSKKSVATVKKVSKKSKVTGIKVTAKKAGTATITVKVTKGTYKGTYKCKVTVKKKASATKAPTQAPTEVPTATPEVTVEPTVEPTTTPAITAEPATTPAITATPEVKSVVKKADDVLKDGKTFKVSLSLETALKADDLKDTTIKLTKGSTVVTGKFANLDASGKAVYEITDDADVKALTPGDTTANGTYKVTSDAKVLVLENITTVYEEALAGNAIEGFVTTKVVVDGNDKYVPVKDAVVSVDGGQSKTTDANGYYKLPSVNGQKKVSVKAAGYLDNNNDGKRVYVNRNHVTSQNFVMDAYDVNKVFTNITVQDETKQKAPVVGATITIADSANKDVIKAVTDANGKVSFGNKSVTDDKLTATAADNKKKAADWEQYFVNGQTYTIYAEKKLSIANLNDVFVKQKIGTFTVGNTYDYSDTFTATRVKKTPSLTLTQKLADTDVTTEVSKTATGSEGKMDVQYTVYTTVNGGAPEKILDETTAVETDKIANNSVATDLISKVSALNNATLPTGNYYVVVNPTDVDKTNSVRVAKAAVKVAVTEGTAAASSVTITRGYLRELETNVALTTEEEKAQGAITTDATLKTVTKTATGYEATTTPVTLDYAVYQMVDGVAIPMETTPNQEVKATAKKTFVASAKEYGRLLGTGTYQIAVEGKYIVNSTKTESINNKVNEKLTYNVDAAWNLIKANIKATDKSVLDKEIKVSDAKLMKVVAKNVSTGELTTIFDALGDKTKGIAPTTSLDTPVAVGTTLDYDLTSKVLSATNLKSGNYILTYSINGYKDVTTTAEVSTIGLLEAVNTFDAALVKATSDKTTIAGKITTKSATGAIAALDGTVVGVKTNTKAFVMLLDSTGKIAAVSKVTADGEYSLVDGENLGADKIVGGAYTLIVRSEGYETKAVTVTVDANKQITENVELEAGACGVIKAVVTDTNVNAITDVNAQPMAYDKLYAVPGTWNTVSGKSYGDLLKNKQGEVYCEYNVGAYVGAVSGKLYTFANLPAGTYTVRAGEAKWATVKDYLQSSDAYNYEDKTVVIKGNGDKAYPEWEFAKVNAAGNGLVDLSVKFDTTAQSAIGTGVYVVVVTDADGNIETKPLMFKDSNTAQTVQVRTGKSYTVTLYTQSGYQVTSNTVNVQKVDTSVSLTANSAEND